MNYYITAFRGTLQGFERGLMNNSTFTLNAKCLDTSFTKSFLKIEDALSAMDIGALFSVSGDIYSVSYSLDKACNFNELFYIIGQYCYKANCTLD